ncbi:gamma-glutamyl-gamma-aminobutyrate hydrolase family protein [Hyphomicrobiales bacterium]|jgi:GMP synthase (glutamine-hydrolysing)|nr:C26 family cysteine hydrolase domain-containing family [Rhodobiaceae bacterium]MBT5640991.1 C26 family cysteine hydrolase domain-containing family [Rhodobiaceae bacterium]MBT6222486.1 C26 family cysteine hydrolase domain-containing family [Rhodobiaceae bacterium]MDB4128100.1 gamma-glutamyl-gamma-aminobutyrate hydrolase family protein [Hyphomicrobiales bacterium]
MLTEKKVLIILHQERSTPGRIGLLLQSRGLRLDIRRPALGDQLPNTLENHIGAIMFGGPMSANDNNDFINYEKDWINIPIKEKKPFLGICLGAQLLTCTLGGSVRKNKSGLVEIGHYPIYPTDSGMKIINWPTHVHQWHKEWMEPPKCCDLLAVGETGEAQAFRLEDNIYGIQFHTELTLAMIHRWLVKAENKLQLPGAQERKKHFEGRLLYDMHVKTWLIDFFNLLFK